MTKMDWGANTQGAIKIYNEGTYLVKVHDWEYLDKNGKTFIQWHLKFEGGIYDGEVICRFDTITEKALWTLGSFISHCGIMTIDLPPMECRSTDFDAVLDKCVGRRVWIHTTVDEARGRNTIDSAKGIRPVEEQAIIKLEPNDLASDPDCPV